ncbi:hypothetical protein SESBI_33868 [Sesbania bispinosa]|nr:hypothetical protein SESBI_33868 [Sesbania bispinosa]
MAARQQSKLAEKLLKKQVLEAKRKEVAAFVESGQGVENLVAKHQRMGMPSPQVAPTISSEVEAPAGVHSKGSSAAQSEERERGFSEEFRVPEITSPQNPNMTTDEYFLGITKDLAAFLLMKKELKRKALADVKLLTSERDGLLDSNYSISLKVKRLLTTKTEKQDGEMASENHQDPQPIGVEMQ